MLPPHNASPLTAGPAATLACLYEATARKPGNVHPGASFDEATTYAAFVASAVVIGPVMAHAQTVGVGQAVFESVRATRQAVNTNTNLGTILLLAPLAAVPAETRLIDGVGAVLDRTTEHDTRAVYDAIRLANAGGLGRTPEADVHADPPPGSRLVDVMRIAADRDLVARQYVNRFTDVFTVAASIEQALAVYPSLETAIIRAYLKQLATCPDSLIRRKCGPETASEASTRAVNVLSEIQQRPELQPSALANFDRWLRADGHRRNPGTTADLIAAALFVLVREGRLNWSEW